jgi:hypothetical protein
MAYPLRLHGTIKWAARYRLKRLVLPMKLGEFWRKARTRCEMERIAVKAQQGAKSCIANSDRILQHGLENSLQITG